MCILFRNVYAYVPKDNPLQVKIVACKQGDWKNCGVVGQGIT